MAEKLFGVWNHGANLNVFFRGKRVLKWFCVALL